MGPVLRCKSSLLMMQAVAKQDGAQPTGRIFAGLMRLPVFTLVFSSGGIPPVLTGFLPVEDLADLLAFFKTLTPDERRGMAITITEKNLFTGEGFDPDGIEKVFANDTDTRRLLIKSGGAFAACCDPWQADALLADIRALGES